MIRPAVQPRQPARSGAAAERSWSRPVIRERDRPQRLHFRLELDPEPLPDPPATLGHQRDDVGGRGVSVILDEVRMLGREAGAADPKAAASGGLEQLPGGPTLSARILRV